MGNAYPDLVSKATFVWQEQYHKFVKMEAHPKWGGKAKRLNKPMRELGDGKVETIKIFQDRLADEVLRSARVATSRQDQYTQARTEAMRTKAAKDGKRSSITQSYCARLILQVQHSPTQTGMKIHYKLLPASLSKTILKSR